MATTPIINTPPDSNEGQSLYSAFNTVNANYDALALSLSGKSDVGHTHSVADIVGLQATLTAIGTNLTTLNSQVNNINGSIDDITGNVDTLYDAIVSINTSITNINTALATQTSDISQINDILQDVLVQLDIIVSNDIPEAPINGQTYGRRDGTWSAISIATPKLNAVLAAGNTASDVGIILSSTLNTSTLTSSNIRFVNATSGSSATLEPNSVSLNTGDFTFDANGQSFRFRDASKNNNVRVSQNPAQAINTTPLLYLPPIAGTLARIEDVPNLSQVTSVGATTSSLIGTTGGLIVTGIIGSASSPEYIKMENTQMLFGNTQSGRIAYLRRNSSQGGNIIVTLPQSGGVLATTGDIPATPNLQQVTDQGSNTTNSIVIDSGNGYTNQLSENLISMTDPDGNLNYIEPFQSSIISPDGVSTNVDALGFTINGQGNKGSSIGSKITIGTNEREDEVYEFKLPRWPETQRTSLLCNNQRGISEEVFFNYIYDNTPLPTGTSLYNTDEGTQIFKMQSEEYQNTMTDTGSTIISLTNASNLYLNADFLQFGHGFGTKNVQLLPNGGQVSGSIQVFLPLQAGLIPTLVANLNTPSTTTVPGTTAIINALALKANLASPVFSGTPTTPTPAVNDNSLKVANTAFVMANDVLKANLASPVFTGTATFSIIAPNNIQVSGNINMSSATINTILSINASGNITSLATATYPTLAELAFVKGVTSAIQTQFTAKANLASPALTGTPTAPTQTALNNSTRIATTAYVDSAVAATNTYTAKTTTYTALSTDNFIDCTTGTFTVTLPTAVGITGKRYTIKNSGTGTITIATTSSQTIDGTTTKTLPVQWGNFVLISDGANWKVVSTI